MVRRRSKTTPLEDVVGLVAQLPWWACLGAALLSYWALSALARPVPVTSLQPGQIPTLMFRSLFQAACMVGQYLVPILCLAAAAVSVVRRRRRSELVASVASVANAKAPDALEGMSWRDFERLVGEAFRLQGYEVTERGGDGPDGGVDLVLRRDREKFLVQCKQWKAFKVGVAVVRELYGVMAAEGAAGGFVVTSGTFTEEAIAFASGRNVRLVDGPKLFGFIQQAKAARDKAVRSGASTRPGRAAPRVQPHPVTPFAVTGSQVQVVCPTCASAMVRRVAKKGGNAGKAFWGCTGYPACKGTRPISEALLG